MTMKAKATAGADVGKGCRGAHTPTLKWPAAFWNKQYSEKKKNKTNNKQTKKNMRLDWGPFLEVHPIIRKLWIRLWTVKSAFTRSLWVGACNSTIFLSKGVLKIDQSVKMPWHRLCMGVASSCSSAPAFTQIRQSLCANEICSHSLQNR